MSKIYSAVSAKTKQRVLSAIVRDVVGARCSIQLSENGRLLIGLYYSGPVPRVGDKVKVDYTSGSPVVYTSPSQSDTPVVHTSDILSVIDSENQGNTTPPSSAEDGETSEDNEIRIREETGGDLNEDGEEEGQVRVIITGYDTTDEFGLKANIITFSPDGDITSYIDADTGLFYAIDAVISGTIVAHAGEIGGFVITDDYLAHDGMSDAQSAGMSPNDYPFYAGALYVNRATAPFRVTPDGIMYSTGAVISDPYLSIAGGAIWFNEQGQHILMPDEPDELYSVKFNDALQVYNYGGMEGWLTGSVNTIRFISQPITGVDSETDLVAMSVAGQTARVLVGVNDGAGGVGRFELAANGGTTTLISSFIDGITLTANSGTNTISGKYVRIQNLDDTGDIVLNDNQTSSPIRMAGSTATHLFYVKTSNNFIGINNDTPTERLDIVGNIKASGTITAGSRLRGANLVLTSGGIWPLSDSTTALQIRDSSAVSVLMNFDTDNGFVGINKDDPAESLDVLGNILASGTIIGSNIIDFPATGAIGDLLVADDTGLSFARLADVAAGQPLLSGGVGVAPTYAGWYQSGTATKTYTYPVIDDQLAGWNTQNIFTVAQRINLSSGVALTITDGTTPAAALITTDRFVLSDNAASPGFSVINANAALTSRAVYKGVRAETSTSGPSAPSVGAYVVSLVGAVYDGSDTQSSAMINMMVDDTVSVGVAKQRIGFWTSLTTGAARLERMVIKPDGAIGIGTLVPVKPLHLQRSTSPTLMGIQTLTTTTGDYAGVVFKVTTNTADDAFRAGVLGERRSDGNLNLHLAVASSGNVAVVNAALTVIPGGQVGIGTTTPTSRLNVTGTDFSTSSIVATRYSSGSGPGFLFRQSGGTEASPTAIGNTIVLGGLYAYGQYDTTVEHFGLAGSLEFQSAEAFSASAYGTSAFLKLTTTGSTTRSTVVTFLYDGKVGIGVNPPTARLHVKGSRDEIQFLLQANSTQTVTNLMELQNSSGSVTLFNVTGDGHVDSSGSYTTTGTSGLDRFWEINATVTSDGTVAGRFPVAHFAQLTIDGATNFATASSALLAGHLGSVNHAVGLSSGISAGVVGRTVIGHASATPATAIGTRGQVVWNALGLVTDAMGVNSHMGGGAASVKATTFSYFKATSGGPINALDNFYGLFLPDISGAAVINNAIKTGLGLVSFGDSVDLASGKSLTLVAGNIITDTTTGTKIGTATTQKLSLWNQTPIVQPANTVAWDTALTNFGLRATGGVALFDSVLTSKIGTSSSLAKSGGSVADYSSDVSVGGTETDIFSYTTPANGLGTNNDKFIGSYSGNFVTLGTETVQLKVYFGGTAIWDSTGVVPAVGTASWRVYVEIIRVSSTVVRYSVSLNTTGASGFVYAISGELTGLTLSNTNILKITGTSSGVGSGTGDIVGKSGYVQWMPAA